MFDIFNKRKLQELSKQLRECQANIDNMHVDMGRLHEKLSDKDDLIAMMDDELLQVVKGRFINKYMTFDKAGTHLYGHVSEVKVECGIVTFITNEPIVITDKFGIHVHVPNRRTGDNIICNMALSHAKHFSHIIKAHEYKNLLEQYAKDNSL